MCGIQKHIEGGVIWVCLCSRKRDIRYGKKSKYLGQRVWKIQHANEPTKPASGVGSETIWTYIRINEIKAEQVEQIKYLEVRIHSKINGKEKIINKIKRVISMYHTINNSFISKREITGQATMVVDKRLFRSVLLYGVMQAVEKRYLRRVKERCDLIESEMIK